MEEAAEEIMGALGIPTCREQLAAALQYIYMMIRAF
jgi:hypothetical protein